MLTSLSARMSGFSASSSATMSGRRAAQRLWSCSRLSVATRTRMASGRPFRRRVEAIQWEDRPAHRGKAQPAVVRGGDAVAIERQRGARQPREAGAVMDARLQEEIALGLG